MSRIYLVRHGRTALNAAGVLRGRLDPSLDEVGRREAERVAAFIWATRDRVAAVVSSPLIRAVETARVIGERAAREIEVDPRLIDRDYGQWAGRSRDEVEAQWGTVAAAPGVEAEARLRARARAAFDAAADRAAGDTAVVMVAHDIVNRVLLADLDPTLGPPDAVPQPTGCCSLIEQVAAHWLVAAVGVVSSAPIAPNNDVSSGL